jgi:hypothetical protein
MILLRRDKVGVCANYSGRWKLMLRHKHEESPEMTVESQDFLIERYK